MTEASTQNVPLRALFSLALRDIKIAHSVFALPFALLAAALALPANQSAATTALQITLIVICMVTARTVAMLVNRIADRHIDSQNPRTARRALASGDLPLKPALAITTTAVLIFIAACAAFQLLYNNPWPLILSLPTLTLVSFYSFTKRFTAAAHLFLGVALAASALAAAIAINPATIGLTTGTITPAGNAIYSLAAFVTLWVAGFDILYALQDLDFDRQAKLHSIPAKLGPKGAVFASRLFHTAAVFFLLLAINADPRLSTITLAAAAIVLITLITEHTILARQGLKALPMAFFTLNGFISLTLGTLATLDIYF